MKKYMVYTSITLNIVLIAACVYIAFYFHLPGKIFKYQGLKQWKVYTEKIVMTGDRLIQDHWKDVLKRDDIVIVSNRGGEISYIRSHLDFILNVKPEICIITANAFDVYLSGSPEDAFNQYKSFIHRIGEHNITPIVQMALIATPEKFVLNDFVLNAKRFNNLLKKYCLAHHIKWLNVNPLLTDNNHYKPQYSSRRGVFLNYHGYEVWGGALLKVLNDV